MAMIPHPQGQPAAAAPPVTIDAVMNLLRDGMMRRFLIDIEVDSIISGDESQERNDRNMFIEATTKYITAWGPIVAQNLEMAPLAGELLLFGTRAYRVGRSLEEVIEDTVQKIDQLASQPKPPPQPSPDEQIKHETAKIQGQAEMAKANASVQEAVTKSQTSQAASQIELAGKIVDHQTKLAAQAAPRNEG